MKVCNSASIAVLCIPSLCGEPLLAEPPGKGLKKYGMFVDDNGIYWAISVAPDPHIPDMHTEMRKLKGADFEFVQPPAGYRPPNDAGL